MRVVFALQNDASAAGQWVQELLLLADHSRNVIRFRSGWKLICNPWKFCLVWLETLQFWQLIATTIVELTVDLQCLLNGVAIQLGGLSIKELAKRLLVEVKEFLLAECTVYLLIFLFCFFFDHWLLLYHLLCFVLHFLQQLVLLIFYVFLLWLVKLRFLVFSLNSLRQFCHK